MVCTTLRRRRHSRFLTFTAAAPASISPLHDDARNAERREVAKWNRAIADLMRRGLCADARRLLDRMPLPSTSSWNTLLRGHLLNRDLPAARAVFDEMPRRDLVSYNTLLHGYAVLRDLPSARKLFDEMPHRDAVSWNTMLSAYARRGLLEEALKVFRSSPERTPVSWNGLLSAFLQNGRFDAARRLFESNSAWDVVSWNAMIDGYMQRGRIRDARDMFDRMPRRDVVSWNIVITGYMHNSQVEEARRLFDAAPVRDVFTWTAMVSGYARIGRLDDARTLFDDMPERNVISWNAMIAGYARHRRMKEARELFDEMPYKNNSSWNTMLSGYAQSGDIDCAREVFYNMPVHDSISWSAMIAAYSQGGFSEEALHMFIEMQRCGENPNRSSFTSILSTCADIAMLDCGRQLHGKLVIVGCHASCFVGNALVGMYCKCGSIDDAYHAFCDIYNKDVVSWNTMIVGYAKHGFGNEALKMFGMMNRTESKPDDITLVAVLSACSHAGLIGKGTNYFYTMHEQYGIVAKAVHYTCMIDILGRAGRLEEAYKLLKDAPFEADATMWGALLGASRKYGNTELGELAAERIFEMEPGNAGMYVLLSNLYAASGKWKNVGKLRVMMRDRGVRKVPGFSWIEVLNKIHTFSVGDSLHPERELIYSFLEELDLRLKKAGYKSSTNMVLHDVEEEEKEHMLKYHSEKLAIAYGILKLPPGRPIRVIKNLRVCEDCHAVIKHISAMEGRLIILRDSNRFHHFKDGLCSCGEYW